MKTFLALVLILVVSAAAFAAVPPADAKKVAVDNNKFACDIYAKLQGDDSANLFFSPYSISTALGMTMAGARGDTEKQMAATLHFDLPQAELHHAFKNLAESIQAGAGKKAYELNIANALWGQKGFEFNKPFLDLTEANYSAGLKQVDFKGATEESRKTINAWVEKKTNDKIKDLLKSGVLNDQTRLVLTNAIYFKGAWRNKFEAAATKDEKFLLAQAKETPVNGPKLPAVMAPLMFQSAHFRYLENDTMQALEMPYGSEQKDGQGLSMMVLLPKKKYTVDGLKEIEQSLKAESIQKWAGAMNSVEVHVYLPKFKLTCEFSLADTLKALGMKDAFDAGKADFSGMSTSDKLFISAVVHKAFVDVNEEGTEAAAATGVAVATMSVQIPDKEPPTFRADHPFIFLIRDNTTGSILFMGRCMNPTK